MFGYEMVWFGMHLLSTLFWIALLAALVFLVVRGVTHSRASEIPVYRPTNPINQPPMPVNPLEQPSAIEILRQRYARGEIDAETFDRMRERLEAPMPAQAQQ